MKQVLFSVTYLLIVSASGLTLGVPVATALAAVTAVLAFLTEEMRGAPYAWGVQWSVLPAAASWITGVAAGLALIV